MKNRRLEIRNPFLFNAFTRLTYEREVRCPTSYRTKLDKIIGKFNTHDKVFDIENDNDTLIIKKLQSVKFYPYKR